MPNWCCNDLELENKDDNKIEELKEYIDNEKGLFSYLKSEGDWGCSSDASIDESSVVVTQNRIRLSFETRWSPPIKLYEYLIKETNWNIIHALYDEPNMMFVGEYKNGKNSHYQYTFNNQNWRDTIPEHLIEYANIEESYEEHLEYEYD